MIERGSIVRAVGDEHQIAYSTTYLREAGNINVQARDTRGHGRREITTAPYSIVYDERSGNVIVAMGFQGVVVGAPDGRWTRVRVGRYGPSEFSVVQKFLLLLDWGIVVDSHGSGTIVHGPRHDASGQVFGPG